MEDIKILKENVKEAFKDGDNFDFSKLRYLVNTKFSQV